MKACHFRTIPAISRGLVLATTLAIVSLLVVDIWDGDIFWHVGIGRYILEHRIVPTVNLFSVADYGRPYHDSHWLFQVLVAAIDRPFGMIGVQLFMMGLWGAIFVVSFRSLRRWTDTGTSLILLFIAAVACSGRFTPRPDVVSCFMVALFYHRLQADRFRTLSDVSVLLLMQVLWTNSHGLFVLGPFMVGCYLLGALIRRGWTARHGAESSVRADLIASVVLCVAILLSTGIAPFGFKGWVFAWRLSTELGPAAPEFFKTILEFMTPFSAEFARYPDVWVFIALLICFVGVALMAAWRRTMTPERLLIVMAFMLISVRSVRNIPFFVLTASPFMAEQLAGLFRKMRVSRSAMASAAAGMLLVALLPVSGVYYQFMRIPARFGLGVSAMAFPVDFPPFLKQTGFDAIPYHPMDLGGFCLYHGLMPLFDSRLEDRSLPVLEDLTAAPYDPVLWRSVLERFQVEGLLLRNDVPEGYSVLPRLALDMSWKLVYADPVASFWLRRSGRWAAVPQYRFDRSALTALDGREPEGSLAFARFFGNIRQFETALFLLNEAHLRWGEREDVLALKLQMERDTGRLEDARKTATLLERLNPGHALLRPSAY